MPCFAQLKGGSPPLFKGSGVLDVSISSALAPVSAVSCMAPVVAYNRTHHAMEGVDSM